MSYGDRVSLATPHFYQNSSLIIGHERKTNMCMVPQNQHKLLRDTLVIKYYMNTAGRADERRMAGRDKILYRH